MKTILKRVWLAAAICSLILAAFLWFGNESPNLIYAILAANALMFVLSVPCSIFAVPVIFCAWYFLEINPVSVEGVYVGTVFLSVLGFVQWFWLVKVWSPTEPVLQKLHLYSVNQG